MLPAPLFPPATGTFCAPEPLPGTPPQFQGLFKGLLLPGGLPPSHPAIEGSLLDHTRFQLRIQLLEKENAAPTSPSSQASLLGWRETLFKGGGAHPLGVFPDRSLKASAPLKPRIPGTGLPEVHPPVPPPKRWRGLLGPLGARGEDG